MKVCLKCHKGKPQEDFTKRGEKRRGVCKECTNEQAQIYKGVRQPSEPKPKKPTQRQLNERAFYDFKKWLEGLKEVRDE
ncbi:hypothetical protein [Streptomyces sp. NPDC005385]|uniref:hypothetical protein n=1 Tax=Streptomyces sp. NPDC005385 TaxID=3157039 RepID=UPI0033AF6CAA